jgi:hypothetical protein
MSILWIKQDIVKRRWESGREKSLGSYSRKRF